MKHQHYDRYVRAAAVLCFSLLLGVSCYNDKDVTVLASADETEKIEDEVVIKENLVAKSTILENAFDLEAYKKGEDGAEIQALLNAESIGTRYVSGSCVNLRKDPSLDSEVIKRLSRNVKVELLSEGEGDFSCIRVKEYVGYMHKDYLSKTEIKIVETPQADYSHVGNLQERVAAIAKNNQGTQPCISGYCAKWVSGVYQAAGIGYPGGDAIDYWLRWGTTGSTSIDNIPVGAAVVGSGSGSDDANLYGHVGIYIGNGLVADNVGRHRIVSIWEWANGNVGYCRGYHGYIGWVWPFGTPLN